MGNAGEVLTGSIRMGKARRVAARCGWYGMELGGEARLRRDWHGRERLVMCGAFNCGWVVRVQLGKVG